MGEGRAGRVPPQARRRGGDRLADPAALVDAQRLELLRRLRELQELGRAEPPDGPGAAYRGAALRLQADVRWLEAWSATGSRRSRDERVIEARDLVKTFERRRRRCARSTRSTSSSRRARPCRSWDRAAVASRPSCICSVGSNVRRGRFGSRASGWTGPRRPSGRSAPPEHRVRLPGVQPGRRAHRGRERRASRPAPRRGAQRGRRKALSLLERLRVAERAGHCPTACPAASVSASPSRER